MSDSRAQAAQQAAQYAAMAAQYAASAASAAAAAAQQAAYAAGCDDSGGTGTGPGVPNFQFPPHTHGPSMPMSGHPMHAMTPTIW
ncbi:MAG: hypothetical protein ACI9HK_002508 [Pirellulaceae bacterium]|jgi:hypothetical protein